MKDDTFKRLKIKGKKIKRLKGSSEKKLKQVGEYAKLQFYTSKAIKTTANLLPRFKDYDDDCDINKIIPEILYEKTEEIFATGNDALDYLKEAEIHNISDAIAYLGLNAFYEYKVSYIAIYFLANEVVDLLYEVSN